MKNLNALYEIKSLVPTPPLYIVAPGYDEKISGIVVLHYLCHYLNEIGVSSFLYTNITSGFLNTPILTPEIYNEHNQKGQNPIGIYPEIYIDNPLQLKNIVRFLLNKPGERPWINQMSDIEKFWHSNDRKKEFILHYSDEFMTDYLESRRLYVPAINRKYFYTEQKKIERSGFIVYSHRVELDESKLPSWMDNVITVSMKNPKSAEELGELYRHSRALVLAERTAAHIEALVCGCPVIAVPSNQFSEIPSFSMFGNLGTAWGADEGQLAWAEMTVSTFRSVYEAYENSFHVELTERLLDIVRYFFGQRA